MKEGINVSTQERLNFMEAKLWHSLPVEIRQASWEEQFKKRSYGHFMDIVKCAEDIQCKWSM